MMKATTVFRVVVVILLVAFAVTSAQDVFGQDGAGDQQLSQKAEDQAVLDLADKLPEQLNPSEFDAQDIVAANTMVQSLHIADWLGPLAPLALSPFFGLACLSGLAIWGPDWLAGNAMLASSGPLKHQAVFGVLACLAVLTSLPRLTKVSKPIAQALDQVETYSVIIILLVIKIFSSGQTEPVGPPVAVIEFGMVSMTGQTLLAIAMVINIIVINSVKFFFEVLIWLTPIPAADAMFEIANKAVCAGLMALYAFSPLAATLVNLAMLFAALIVFRWTHRRLRFYRSMLLDLFLSRLWKSYGQAREAKVIAFAKAGPDPFVAKTRWHLTRDGNVWKAERYGLFGVDRQTLDVVSAPQLRRGWVMHLLRIQVSDGRVIEFHLSRRYDGDWESWLERCGFEIDSSGENVVRGVETARKEFA